MTRRAAACSIVLALVATLVMDGSASAADPIIGSGSTFAQIALDQWKTDVNREFGLKLDYTASGSSAGLNQFKQGIVDFASSDVPFPETEVVDRAYAYLPIVAGGTAVMYNLPDRSGTQKITNLRLSGRTVAEIFFGQITNWNDPKIAADNPHLANRLPANLPIKRAVRTSGSGTTAVFTDYLSSIAPDLWNDFVARGEVITQDGGNYTTDWPATTTQFDCGCYKYPGSSEITTTVKSNTPGSLGTIGYAEYAYPAEAGVPVAALQNAAGNWVLPTARNVAVALLDATENGDGTQNLDNVFTNPRPEAYPSSSYNYLVIPTADDFPAGKGDTLGQYIIHSVTAGQGKAAELHYSPLPPNLVQFALNRVREINGAPEPPPLGDWGQFYLDLEVEVVQEPPADTTPPNNPGDTTPGGGGPNNPGDTTPGGGDPNNPGDTTPGETDDDGDGTPTGGNGGGTNAPGATARPGAVTTAAGATTTDPCVAPSSTTSTVPSASAAPDATTTSTTTSTTVPGATTIAPTTVVTSTTVPCVPSSSVAPRGGATVTSIGADGSVVVVETAEDQSSMIGLNPALRFGDDGELETNDGRKVPKVPVIGIAPLVATAIILIALLVLPPLLVGTGVFKRRGLRG